MLFIKRILIFVFATFVFLFSQILAQHKTINDKIKSRNPAEKNIVHDIKQTEDIIKIRNPKPLNNKTIIREEDKGKIINPNTQRAICSPRKPTKGVTNIEPNIDEFNYQQTENLENVKDDLQSLEDVYPNFPLRFISGEITYSYSYFDENSKKNEDVYELNITIIPKSTDYISYFGVMIIYSESLGQLEVFNEDKNNMYFGNSYVFNKELILEQTGYINLRIGYYAFDEDIFYPETEIPKKTDLLIFVNKPNKRVFYEE